MWKAKKYRDGKPVILELKGEGISITIVENHINCPDEWVMHCHSLNMNTVRLGTQDFEEAKEKAIALVASKIDRMSRFINRYG